MCPNQFLFIFRKYIEITQKENSVSLQKNREQKLYHIKSKLFFLTIVITAIHQLMKIQDVRSVTTFSPNSAIL